MRLTTLLALSRPCWSVELAGLQLSSLKLTPEGATFMARHLAKQSRPGQSLKEFFFPSLPDNPALCPVSTLYECILQIKQFREGKDGDYKDRLFITNTGGHSLLQVLLLPDGLCQPSQRHALTPLFLKLIH